MGRKAQYNVGPGRWGVSGRVGGFGISHRPRLADFGITNRPRPAGHVKLFEFSVGEELTLKGSGAKILIESCEIVLEKPMYRLRDIETNAVTEVTQKRLFRISMPRMKAKKLRGRD